MFARASTVDSPRYVIALSTVLINLLEITKPVSAEQI